MPTLTESIRHYSNIVVLNESIKDDVKNMFTIMDIDPKDKEWLDREFDWARETFVTVLDRGDNEHEMKSRPNKERIMWYMRVVKLHLLEKSIDGSDERQKIYNKAVQKMATKAGDNTTDIEAGVAYAMRSAFKTQMEHFMSLSIYAITTMTFSWEAPQKLVAHMEAAEKDWQSDQRAIVEIQDEDEILIDFNDGYAWWNLNRSSCDLEGAAMGHCGNGAGNHGDNILSLRRKAIGEDKEEHWSPVATFILDGNNIIGEMKGRFNEKPGEEFHPYIIALLKHNIVEGIKGGGYLPQNNFNLNDLDDDVREELLEDKPELAGISWLFDKEGYSDKFASRLDDVLQSKDIYPRGLEVRPPSDNGNRDVVVDEWTDFSQFLRDVSDDHLLKILEFYEEGPDMDEMEPDEDYYIEMLDRLPLNYQRVISDEIGVDITTRDITAIRKAVDTMLTGPREHYRFIEYMNKALAGTLHVDKGLKEKVKDRIQEYIEAGFSFYSYHVRLEMDVDDFDKPLKAVMGLDDLVGYADAEDDEDDYNDYYDIYNVREYGYTAIDFENINELRGSYNADLVDSDGEDKELKDIMDMATKGDTDLNSSLDKFEKIFDTNEHRLTEELLNNIRRLSGISS